VGLENQDAVIEIDTLTNKIIATIPVGQQPQALVYVPGAVPTGDGTANMVSLSVAGNAAHLRLMAPPGSANEASATVSFKTNLVGAQVAQTIGPLRQVLSPTSVSDAKQAKQRFLLITAVDSDTPELVQSPVSSSSP
jgi:YVTN family beta-propeller protein